MAHAVGGFLLTVARQWMTSSHGKWMINVCVNMILYTCMYVELNHFSPATTFTYSSPVAKVYGGE